MATDKFVVTGDQYRMVDRRLREIQRQLDQDGGSPLDPEQVAEALQKIVEGRLEILMPEARVVESPTHPVTVDYGMTLEQMIAAGRYDSQNGDITAEHFPLQGTGKVEVELHLVHLNKVVSTEEVLAELDRRNLRPAKIEEILALGAKYPNLQKEFPVVALGSVWQRSHGDRYVACLGRWLGERCLDLGWFGSDWDGHFRFAAVSK